MVAFMRFGLTVTLISCDWTDKEVQEVESESAICRRESGVTKMLRYLFGLLLTVAMLPSMADDAMAPGPNSLRQSRAAPSGREAQVLVLVYEHLLQPYPFAGDRTLGAVMKDIPQSGPGSQLPAAAQPLASELTVENTQSKLIEAIRSELYKIGVETAGVSVQSYANARERDALEHTFVALPHHAALIIVSPRLVLWQNGHALLLLASVDISPPDSSLMRVASTCVGGSKIVKDADPFPQWSADSGARFFYELGVLDEKCGQNVASAFQQSAENDFGRE